MLNKIKITFATRLLLRYFIIYCQPAINEIPNTIPIRIPEIKPILILHLKQKQQFGETEAPKNYITTKAKEKKEHTLNRKNQKMKKE